MAHPTPTLWPALENDPTPIPSGQSSSWLALGLISSSYFFALASVLAFCLVLPCR